MNIFGNKKKFYSIELKYVFSTTFNFTSCNLNIESQEVNVYST